MGGVNRIYGIIGHPVLHSLSPAMHNAALAAANLQAEYRIFDIDPADPENLANFCYETDVNEIGGFSVTMPYKEAVMQYMDHYDPLAKAVGSINTVVNEDSKLIGYNTDATGALQALLEKTKLDGKRVLLLGAGGAARAIAYGLKQYGTDIHVWSRTMEHAQELADNLNLQTIEYRHIAGAKFDIIINATPVGMAPGTTESLLHADQIHPGALVMDVVTHPMETQLLKEAKKAVCDVITGERMLLFQAAGQFELWFGKAAPVDVMEKALYEEIARRAKA